MKKITMLIFTSLASILMCTFSYAQNYMSKGITSVVNDEATTATVLNCGSSIEQTIVGASSSLVDECSGNGSSDVWFTFTNDGSKTMSVQETSGFDAVVQLFKASDCGNLIELGTCQDSPEHLVTTEAGTYYFRVRPWSAANDGGTILVELSCDPIYCDVKAANVGDACDDGDVNTINDVINNDCNCIGVSTDKGSVCGSAFALVFNAAPVIYSSSNSIATNQTSCSIGNKGLWFSFMGTGYDIIVNSSADFDHEMSINSGSCGSLVNISCNDASANSESYTISSSLDGQMYFIYVASAISGNNSTGNISMSIECTTLSINENNKLTGTRLFPNPLNDSTFFIQAPKLNGEHVEVIINDLVGRQVLSNVLIINKDKVAVSVNEILTSGIYLVTLKHAGEIQTYRLIKE